MTRPFRFTLDKVLEYREQAEDQAQMALSQARLRLQQQQELVARLESDMVVCQSKMAESTMTQADLWLWSGWRKSLEREKQQAEAALVDLEKLVETRRRELVVKSTDRKLLDKLRIKQRQKHEQNDQHKEQNEFDESATLRHGRAHN